MLTEKEFKKGDIVVCWNSGRHYLAIVAKGNCCSCCATDRTELVVKPLTGLFRFKRIARSYLTTRLADGKDVSGVSYL